MVARYMACEVTSQRLHQAIVVVYGFAPVAAIVYGFVGWLVVALSMDHYYSVKILISQLLIYNIISKRRKERSWRRACGRHVRMLQRRTRREHGIVR